MTRDLDALLLQLQRAHRPEDIFGDLAGSPEAQLEEARRRFRALAREVHPDRWSAHPAALEDATLASQLLNAWWDTAQRAIAAGVWGAAEGAGAVIASSRATYTVLRQLATGDLTDVFLARSEAKDGAVRRVVLKITRATEDNDLAFVERDALQALWGAEPAEVKVFGRYLPEPLDSFRLPDDRQVLVLAWLEGYRSLAEVLQAYPQGVDLRTMAWMLRRTLELLGWVHQQGLVHGAITPDHLLIHPKTHGAALLDWSYATRPARGGHIPAISPAWRELYPPEVFDKRTPTPATDLYMAARCMIRLLGADQLDALPNPLPESVAGLLRAATIPNPHHRYNDAVELYDNLRDTLERLFGPPSFHPFKMP